MKAVYLLKLDLHTESNSKEKHNQGLPIKVSMLKYLEIKMVKGRIHIIMANINNIK